MNQAGPLVRSDRGLNLFQYAHEFRVIVKTAVRLEIITRFAFGSKKDEFHPGFFGTDKVFARIVTDVDRFLGL